MGCSHKLRHNWTTSTSYIRLLTIITSRAANSCSRAIATDPVMPSSNSLYPLPHTRVNKPESKLISINGRTVTKQWVTWRRGGHTQVALFHLSQSMEQARGLCIGLSIRRLISILANRISCSRLITLSISLICNLCLEIIPLRRLSARITSKMEWGIRSSLV